MVTNTGYRQMLRDRTPKIVIYALKWCRVQEAWLDHVYNNWIWLYKSNEERLGVTKKLLGLDKKPNHFVFKDTIMWDNFTQEEKNSWENVVSWVSWFQETYAYIENAYSISKTKGKDIVDIKLEIMENYLSDYCPTEEDSNKERERKSNFVNKLCDFLINCFENRI